jgi:nitrilase
MMTKLAAIQMASGSNVDANLMEAKKLIGDAAKAGAKLVVLPENFALMPHKDADKLDIAEADGSGKIQTFLSEQAKKREIWLVGGTIPVQSPEQDKVYATSYVYDAQGEVQGRYDKIHLFDANLISHAVGEDASKEAYFESKTTYPGDAIQVIDTPFGKLGVAVCYDLRFPELFRQLHKQGVEFIAIPSAFTAITGRAHWEVLVRARAIENLCYIVAAAQGGYHTCGRETYGDSMVVDPWGIVLDRKQKGNGFVIAEIDPDKQESIRRNLPVDKHRRLG